MKRGSLFFIGLISAIITIISLNYAFGSSLHYNRYPYYCRHRYRNDRNDRWQEQNENLKNDSTQNNY